MARKPKTRADGAGAVTPPSELPASLSILGPAMKVIREAILQVPAVRYALGVAGLAAAGAIATAFYSNLKAANVTVVAVVVCSVLLFVFARLSISRDRSVKLAGRILMFASIFFFVFILCMVMSALTVRWPEPIAEILGIAKAAEAKAPVRSSVENTDFRLTKDISIYDLRGWKLRPASAKTHFSRTTYFNYLHVEKLSDNQDRFTAEYSSSGDIDVRCISHQAKVTKLPGEGEDSSRYRIDVDVRGIEKNKEFLVIIEATYWDSEQNDAEGSFATYTDDDIDSLGELAIVVFFPEGKPVKNYQLFKQGKDSGERQQYRDPSRVYLSPDNNYIYWSITSKEANKYYELAWTW